VDEFIAYCARYAPARSSDSSIREFDPDECVIARLVAASHVAIDLSREQAAGDFIQQLR